MQIKRAIALGSFDGLHLGHMAVMSRALSYKSDSVVPCVLLFDKHPKAILHGGYDGRLLSENDCEKIITDMGLSILSIPFESVAELDSEEFAVKILKEKFNASIVCCGYNHRFGKGANGTPEDLQDLCKGLDIGVDVCPAVNFEGLPISTSRIKHELSDGNVRKANLMLGRNFSYTANVFHGDHRGHTLGFPTINQRFDEDFFVPRFGVYKSQTIVNGVVMRSMTNIGIRPTIGTQRVQSETHIFDFDGDLYGRDMTVELLDYIRDEEKFGSLEALCEQMNIDKQIARGETHG